MMYRLVEYTGFADKTIIEHRIEMRASGDLPLPWITYKFEFNSREEAVREFYAIAINHEIHTENCLVLTNRYDPASKNLLSARMILFTPDAPYTDEMMRDYNKRTAQESAPNAMTEFWINKGQVQFEIKDSRTGITLGFAKSGNIEGNMATLKVQWVSEEEFNRQLEEYNRNNSIQIIKEQSNGLTSI